LCLNSVNQNYFLPPEERDEEELLPELLLRDGELLLEGELLRDGELKLLLLLLLLPDGEL